MVKEKKHYTFGQVKKSPMLRKAYMDWYGMEFDENDPNLYNKYAILDKKMVKFLEDKKNKKNKNGN